MVTLKLTTEHTGHEFLGLGSITSNGMSKLLYDYKEEIKDEIIDLLFRPDYGVAFHTLKVEIGSDVNSSCGTEPSHMRAREDCDITRGVGLRMAAEARKRNPNLILGALRWGTPKWINNYEDKLQFYLSFLQEARRVYGLEFDYLGPDVNEGDFDPYWTAHVLYPALREHGFENVKITAADHDKNWLIADLVREDAALAQSVDSMGIHYKCFSTPAAKQSGKPLILSEELAPYNYDFCNGSLETVYRALRMYPDGRMVKCEIHPIVESQYDSTPFGYKGVIRANTPWNGKYEITKGFYLIAHITRFVKPGYHYVKDACFYDDTCAVSTLVDPEQRRYTSVFCNKSDQERSFHLNIARELNQQRRSIYITDVNRNMAEDAGILKEEELHIPPYSVVTMTTTGAEAVRVKEPVTGSEGFLLPVSYDFTDGNTKYFSDQGGSFEISEDKEGVCFIQQIDELYIPDDWTYRATPKPYTLFGPTDLVNYRVQVEASFPSKPDHYLLIGGRINYCEMKKDYYPGGYYLKLYGDGTLILHHGINVLFEGSIEHFESGKPFTLALSFCDNILKIICNDELTGEVEAASVFSGQVAIGSGYHEAKFYHFKLTKIQGYDHESKIIPVMNQTLQYIGTWETLKGNFHHYHRHAKKVLGEEAAITFTFRGTAFALIGDNLENTGVLKAELDGKPCSLIPNSHYGCRRMIGSLYRLENKPHQVIVWLSQGTILDSIEYYE